MQLSGAGGQVALESADVTGHHLAHPHQPPPSWRLPSTRVPCPLIMPQTGRQHRAMKTLKRTLAG